jgi:hypothetical protein
MNVGEPAHGTRQGSTVLAACPRPAGAVHDERAAPWRGSYLSPGQGIPLQGSVDQ